MPQTVFQRTNYLSAVLERLSMGNLDLEYESGYGHGL